MNFGSPPKAVPSGRGQQNHQPHLALVLVELGFEVADVRRKLAPAAELINGQGREPEQHRRHDAYLDINAFHIYTSNNSRFPPLSAGTAPNRTNRKRNNHRGAA